MSSINWLSLWCTVHSVQYMYTQYTVVTMDGSTQYTVVNIWMEAPFADFILVPTILSLALLGENINKYWKVFSHPHKRAKEKDDICL